MTFNVGQFTTKTQPEIHDDILRVVRNGLIQRGVPNPQFGPGSDEDIWATALANELAPLYVNTVIKADAQMPDTATGADLDRLLAQVGLTRRPASPSAGFIALDCSATTIIPDDAQLVDAAGLRYGVEIPGSYAAGALVELLAVDTGAATNHFAGDTLIWVTAPPYCNTKQLVATGGLTGGAPAEDDETARARLLDRLANPPGSGNSTQVAKYAEDSTSIVQKAFVYPAAGGPSTCHVAVVGYATSVSKHRDVDATVMTSTVAPVVIGQMPEYVETVVTTVTNQDTDMAIGLTLPASAAASPPGPGGGWKDGTPWPAISGVQQYANVTAFSPGGLSFTVNAPTPPQDNVSHICFLDPSTWTLYRAKVLTHSGSAGAYVVTVDKPFPNLTLPNIITGYSGSLIFPDAVNMQTYVTNLLAALALMGPGEKTANASLLTRAFRHPLPAVAWPYSLSSQILKQVENSGDEVTDTAWYYRQRIVADVPLSILNPPNQITPSNLAFYPI